MPGQNQATQNQPQQPITNQPQSQGAPQGNMTPVPPSKSAAAIVSLILGIIAILLSFLPIINNFAFFLALIGLVFGIVGLVGISKGKKSGKGMAIAAIVVCALSCIIVLGTQSMYSSAINGAANSSTTQASTSTSNAAGSGSTSGSSSTSSDSSSSENASGVSTEYKNALAKAKTYSDTMYMSKQGIYDQLTSEYGEKFPADAAQYAIDNLNADYNKNALEKAKQYQKTANMSSAAIYDQLISQYGEKFTEAEAQYAIDNL